MGLIGFHCGQFLEALVAHLNPERVTIHFDKHLVTYFQEEGAGSPVEMQFMSGTTATADVLIGSDRIRSAVWHIILESLEVKLGATGLKKDWVLSSTLQNSINLVCSGLVTYCGIIPCAKVEEAHPEMQVLLGPVIVNSLLALLLVGLTSISLVYREE